MAVDDFPQGADLPGDLVDGDVLAVAALGVGGAADVVVVHDEGVVIGGIAEEIALVIAEALDLVRHLLAGEGVANIGDPEAQELAVEP